MSIPAVYKKGVIKPMGNVDLKENEKIEIEIKRKGREITKKIAGSLKLEDEKLIEAIAESEDWL